VGIRQGLPTIDSMEGSGLGLGWGRIVHASPAWAVRLASLAAVTVAVLLVAAPAGAETLRVTRTDDPPPTRCMRRDCSLREAVIEANQHRGRDEIVLESGAIYTLSQAGSDDDGLMGDLDIAEKVTIRASGAQQATIDAQGIDGVFEARSGHCRFEGLVVRGGNSSSGSGGIAATGAVLVVVDSLVVGNSGRFAGGILSRRRLELKGTTVRENTGNIGGIKALTSVRLEHSAIQDNKGQKIGGLDSGSGTARISSSEITGNAGVKDTGGILSQAEVVIRHSTVAENRGASDGGLAHFDVFGSMLIVDSVIRDNEGGGAGGIRAIGPTSVVRSTVANNRGGQWGGAYVGGRLEMRRSTVSGNSSGADGGGLGGLLLGAHLAGKASIVNSTVAGNTADRNGGGLALGHLSLRSSTIAYNRADDDEAEGGRGGGIFVTGSPRADYPVVDSLIALNTVGATGSDPQCAGRFASRGHNLRSSDDPGCIGFDRAGDLVAPDPLIDTLAENGGPTQTIALQPGSPAIGAASRKTSSPRDQRGVRRDRHPDIGAFERR
jgi:hypothetical protein